MPNLTHLPEDPEHTLSNRFNIISFLGKGSFGNVYECQQRKTKQVYAIKIISKLSVKKSRIQCLKEEAALLKSLNHQNIVKVHQYFQNQKIMFIKMQLIKGGTLGQLMKQRKDNHLGFNDLQVAQIMKAILEAVNYIHSLSVLHRDIKPENILLPDKKNFTKLKVADFGLGAKLEFRSPTATSKCGTYLYMAPEIMWNYTYTKAVDIWSCAIIMFMLKKGYHPFYEVKMTNDEFKQKIKDVIFPPISEQNPELLDNKSAKSSKQYKQEESLAGKKKKLVLAQDFMSRISKLSPNQRYTAQDAIKHPWITRNFQDQIPLSLHDSFQGFQISHEISLMAKMFIMLKHLYLPKEQIQKIKKNDIFEKYAKKCEEVNKSQRCESPLKVRRLSALNSTRQIRQLCQLSQLSISPKKSKQNVRLPSQVNDPTNPTIMKLNKIFNNLFQKKQKKQLNYAEQFMSNLQAKGPCLNEVNQIPDISAYKLSIQLQLQKAVKQRARCKKQRILPLRKKNQYGIPIGISACQHKKSPTKGSQLSERNQIKEIDHKQKDSIRSAKQIHNLIQVNGANVNKMRMKKKSGTASINVPSNQISLNLSFQGSIAQKNSSFKYIT